jgi:hypothetical protein
MRLLSSNAAQLHDVIGCLLITWEAEDGRTGQEVFASNHWSNFRVMGY